MKLRSKPWWEIKLLWKAPRRGDEDERFTVVVGARSLFAETGLGWYGPIIGVKSSGPTPMRSWCITRAECRRLAKALIAAAEWKL